MPLIDQLKVSARRVVRGMHGRLDGAEFAAPDWDVYAFDLHQPFAASEPAERERRTVAAALQALQHAGLLDSADYDDSRYGAFSEAVQQRFDIPWSAISPRVRRLLWAIGAIHRPQRLVAAGVFCGFTFICNAGAAVGPGAVYRASELVGVEIAPDEALRAERNVRRLDASSIAHVVAADAVEFCRSFAGPIDLLYLDAEAPPRNGRSIYLEVAEAAWDRLAPGALLLAHNSVNQRSAYADYLSFVRDRAHCRASVNIVIDREGLEVSSR